MKAAQYFKECLTCVYENTRCLAKLQLLWKYLLAQPNASYLISVDIAEVCASIC